MMAGSCDRATKGHFGSEPGRVSGGQHNRFREVMLLFCVAMAIGGGRRLSARRFPDALTLYLAQQPLQPGEVLLVVAA